jgi:Protein of unknown function (DUF3558)
VTLRLHRPRALACGLVLIALVAACGGSTPTTPPAGTGAGLATSPPANSTPSGNGTATQGPGAGATVDPCALLTTADIEAVTGHETTSSTAGPQGGVFPSGCLWELVGERPLIPPTIALGVMATGGKDFYDRNFKALNAVFEPIDGLGDVAVDADFGTVHVVSGDVFFQVQYIGDLGGDDNTAKATELARTVIVNLGR